MNKKYANFRSLVKNLFIVAIGIFLSFTAAAQTSPIDFSNFSSITQDLKVPVRVAIDNNDNIYVTDASQKCIVQYDASRNFVGKIYVGTNPTSLAIADNGTIFVGDGVNGKIYKRLGNGTTSVIFSDTIFPSSMVVSPNNNLFVVDSRSKKVLVMDFAGNIINTIGAGIFLYPTGIAFDRKNNRIIVAEHGGFGNGFNLHTEIRIFGLTGNLISTFGGWGNTPGKFYRVQGLTVGRCGNIYVTDPFQGNISVFNQNGVYITKFGQWGDTLGQLNVPLDVVFDSQERVLVTSLNNSALEVFNITDSLPSSTITSGSASICAGNTTPIEINFTGTAPWTFTYTIDGTNPQTVSNVTNNPYILNANLAGAYNVTALSDANHTGTCFSRTANVILNPVPTATMASINQSICQGESINIPITFTGTAPWEFSYTIDGTNPVTVSDIYTNNYNLTATNSGTYEISSLNSGNCLGSSISGIANISINSGPTSNIISDNTIICSGSSTDIQVNLTGTSPWNITYSVNGQNPLTYTNISTNPFIINATNPGNYEIVALTDANCIGSTFNGNTIITERQLPLSNIISGNSSICANESTPITIDLLGNSPWTLTYTDGTNSNTVSNITSSPYTFNTQIAGIYEVISLSDAYCTGINYFGNSIVNVNPLPLVDLGTDINLCAGQTANLDGGINDFYLWNDLTTNQILTVNTTGNYSLTVTDINGCQNSDQVFVNVTPTPVSAFTFNSNNLEITFTNNSLNATTYLWDFGDGTIATDLNPIHNYSSTGIYVVTLTVTSPTCGTSTFTVTINIITTSIGSNNSTPFFNVYPNPSNGIVTIDINNPNGSIMKLNVYNSIGQIVLYKEINSKRFTEQIDMRHFAAGVYSVRLVSSEISKITKLVLEK